MSESMCFYRSYMEALEEIEDPEVFRDVVQTLFYYACDGIEPTRDQLKTPESRIIWKLVKPLIDANTARRENGKLGGRPRKQSPKPLEEESLSFSDNVKTIGFDLTKPMVSENKTIGYASAKPNKDKDKDKDKDIYKGDIEGEYEGERYEPPAPPTPRGPHKRVMLTDEQIRVLTDTYGSDTVQEYIRRLDTHLSTGGHKTNHDIVIQDWITRDKAQARQQDRKGGFHNFSEREYDYDLIAEKLRQSP